MNAITLSDIAKITGGQLQGEDKVVSSFYKDTRDQAGGDMYVAIVGEQMDGHVFIPKLAQTNTKALLVSQAGPYDLPCVVVEDTLKALGQIASYWRQETELPIIAVTGSCGKTTVKEILKTILSEQGRTIATEGNYNNHIGLPLSLLKITSAHDYGVFEMGANHPGEIAYLTEMGKPNVAILNNVGPVHLEGFKAVEGVAHAKAEIFQGLSEQGVAVFPADDEYTPLWRRLAEGKKVIIFGDCDAADVRVTAVQKRHMQETQFDLHYAGETVTVTFSLMGEHNIRNAMAATAAALGIGLRLDQIARGLSQVAPVKGRLMRHQVGEGATLIDDTYNANPKSMLAAIQVLATSQGDTTLVVGDMGELGEDEIAMHRDIGMQAKQHGIKNLLAVGELSKNTVEGFGDGATWFKDKQSLIDSLKNFTDKNQTILVKASRAATMEKVVEALVRGD